MALSAPDLAIDETEVGAVRFMVAGLDADATAVITVTGSSGSPVTSGTIAYDSFGNVRAASGALAALPAGGDFRFHAMWLQDDALYYVRARTYDPRVGRFASRDPADGRRARPGSFSPHTFSNDNPYVYRDPSGEVTLSETQTAIVATFVLASAAVIVQGQSQVLECPSIALPSVDEWMQSLLVSQEWAIEIALDLVSSTSLDCEAQWDRAYELCERRVDRNRRRGSRTGRDRYCGGYQTLHDCARGLVTEACGGNAIDWGPDE